jgi:diguanylate cyclase (GGDEF)-like protein
MMADSRSSQPWTIAGAESRVRELERALQAHQDWIDGFQSRLVTRSRPRPSDLKAAGHLHCPFGRWYAGKGKKNFRGVSAFTELGAQHREMHRLARALAGTIRDNADIAVAQYEAFARCLADFRQSAHALLDDARELLRYADPLTGIANRFGMLPRLEEEMERVRRTDVVSTVSIMDLDRFKRINDSLGHASGDKVLRAVSRYLVKNVRRYDRVARYGGEEFLLLLPDTTPAGAKRVLDRLRRGLSRRTIAVNRDTKVTIGASFGVAALNPAHTVMMAIDRADQAMYEAKQAGRNRVQVWEP